MKPKISKRKIISIADFGKIQVGGKPPICNICGQDVLEGNKKTVEHPSGGTKTFWKHYNCKWGERRI